MVTFMLGVLITGVVICWELQKGRDLVRILKKKIWSILWKLNILNAAKVFIWTTCLESLPTNANLFKKRVVDSPDCPIFLREEDQLSMPYGIALQPRTYGVSIQKRYSSVSYLQHVF